MTLHRRLSLALLTSLATGVTLLPVTLTEASAAPAGGDLALSRTTAGPASGLAGSRLTVTYVARNAGSRTVGASTTRVYLTTSTTARRQPSDRLLGSGTLPRLKKRASLSRSIAVSIPSGTRPGSYGLRVCLDARARVRERREANNCRVTRVAVTAASGTPAPGPGTPPGQPASGADLGVTTASADRSTLVEGTELDVTYVARNSGTAAAGPSTTRFYLTTATASARKVPADIRLHGTGDLTGVAAGAGAAGSTVTVRVPFGIPARDYAVRVCADDLGAVAERDETNNCLVVPAPLAVTATPGQLEVQAYTDAEGWYGGDASTLSMLKLLCTYVSPPASFTHESALASIEAQLSATVGASALAQVAASPLAADAVEAQRLAATGVVQESPGLALAAMIRAHRLDPDDAGHLVSVAALAASTGMPNEALALLDAADRREYRDPAMGINQQSIAHSVKGQALMMTGRAAQARTEFAAALEQAPMLSEAAKGLAIVDACAGKDDSALRFAKISKKRRQKKVAEDETPTGPEPNIDMTHGVATPIRQLPIAETPSQGARFHEEHERINTQNHGELDANSEERDALEERLRAVEPLLEPAEVTRRDSLLSLGYAVSQEPDVKALWNDIVEHTDAAHDRVATFFGGGTSVEDYEYTVLSREAADKCLGSPEEFRPCYLREMNAICRPALISAHSDWRSSMGQAQKAADAWMLQLSTRMSAVAANLKDADAHRQLIRSIEFHEISMYGLLNQAALHWTHYEDMYREECVEPLDLPVDPGADAGSAGSPGACPDALKSFNVVLPLSEAVSVKGNCEKLTVAVSPEVMPLLKAFAEFTYDVRSGSMTIVAGSQGGIEAGGTGASFKSGLYVTAGRDGVVDMGWRVGPEVSVAGAVEMGIYGGDVDISFISGPFGG
ncbi:MAG TPA: CARDB domain-containing protein [Nocardioides sp.]|uniref:CARDB domain-containing protein n=1 Tax=Nocardioides sp. TaxID=35761 RepID=UPI002ED97626